MSGVLVFNTTKDATTVELLRLGLDTSTSKLGLGTSTPLYPFHVEGDGYVNSSFYTSLKVQVLSTANQLVLGTTNTVTITAPTPSASRTYTIPSDIGANANFIMSQGIQTINDSKTFSSAVNITPTSNQLVLGTTTTTTITAPTPSASRTYTIPSDIGANANFIMSEGTQTINGSKIYSSAINITPTSNQLVLGTTNTVTITAPTPTTPAAPRTYTIPSTVGADAYFIMSEGTQTINGSKTFSQTVTMSSGLNVAGNGTGIVPLGAIIAMTENFAGAMALPAVGAVNNGYMRCTGAAIPVGNTLSGNTPDLSNSVYLKGFTTYTATAASANDKTITLAQIPSHIHSIASHTHDISHTHGINHDHGLQSSGSALTSHTHTLSSDDTNRVQIDEHAHYLWMNSQYQMYARSNNVEYNTATGFFMPYFSSTPGLNSGQPYPGVQWETVTTTPAGSSSHLHTIPNQTTTGTNLTHSHDIDLNSFTGSTSSVSLTSVSQGPTSTGPAGTGATFNVEPKYITVVYLMRVK